MDVKTLRIQEHAIDALLSFRLQYYEFDNTAFLLRSRNVLHEYLRCQKNADKKGKRLRENEKIKCIVWNDNDCRHVCVNGLWNRECIC